MCNFQRHYHEISQSFHIQFFGGWGYILQKYGRRQAKAPGQLRRGRNEVLFLLNFLHIVCLCLCLISPWFSSQRLSLSLLCAQSSSLLSSWSWSSFMNPESWSLSGCWSWSQSWIPILIIPCQYPHPNRTESMRKLASRLGERLTLNLTKISNILTSSCSSCHSLTIWRSYWFAHFLRWGKHTAGRKRSANGFRSNYEGGLRIERKPLYSHRAAQFKSTANWPFVCVGGWNYCRWNQYKVRYGVPIGQYGGGGLCVCV